LKVGEAVTITDGPKDEKVAAVSRVKVRALMDGSIGWVTFRQEGLKPWGPFYTCKTSIVMQKSQLVSGAEEVRRIKEGEVVEVLDGPVEDADAGVMRIRARAEKNGDEGWITIRDKDTEFLHFHPPKPRK